MKHPCVYESDGTCQHSARYNRKCRRKCKDYKCRELIMLQAMMVTLSDGMKDLRAEMTILWARRDRLIEELGGKK